jgi:hypothetical protein
MAEPRIAVNLMPEPLRWAAGLMALGFASALALAALAVWLASQAGELGEAAADTQQRIERYREVAAPAALASMPGAAELAALRARVRVAEGLWLVDGWSSARMLDWLAAAMPAQARLISLNHRGREGETTLIAEVEHAQALAALLTALQQEPQFAEVLLVRQERLRGESALRVELRLKERKS